MNFTFFTNKQKVWVGPLGILAFVFFYMLPNHFPIFEPMYLPAFSFERTIPFIDWTIWFYISDYLYIGLVFFLLKEGDNMNKIFYSQISLLFFGMIIFFLFPTAFPRPEVEYSGMSGVFVRILHSTDSPGNACPSIHVAMTFLAGFGFLKEKKYLFPLFMFWALVISASTLTIKQHYLLDILMGFVVAVVFYYMGTRFIRDGKREKVRL